MDEETLYVYAVDVSCSMRLASNGSALWGRARIVNALELVKCVFSTQPPTQPPTLPSSSPTHYPERTWAKSCLRRRRRNKVANRNAPSSASSPSPTPRRPRSESRSSTKTAPKRRWLCWTVCAPHVCPQVRPDAHHQHEEQKKGVLVVMFTPPGSDIGCAWKFCLKQIVEHQDLAQRKDVRSKGVIQLHSDGGHNVNRGMCRTCPVLV